MNDFSNISAESDLKDLITQTPEEQPKGEYYADLNGSGKWCVFHTNAPFTQVFSSWDTLEQADADAAERNGKA